MSAYANSLGNGFAFDDETFIPGNEVVTEQRYADAFTRAAWPEASEGTGNYRPIVLSSLALEWSLWGARPLGYHVVNVVTHALVSALVLALLLRWVPPGAAMLGAALFAIHPVHTEAVANVMGRAELYAALGYLGAALLYLAVTPRTAAGRAARLVALLALFAFALGSKEMAVTLPAALVLIEVWRRADEPLGPRLRREALGYVALAGLLGCYLVVRWSAIGDFTGESAAAGLLSLDSGERVLSALTVWPHYLRLLVFPLDLSADYSPGVLIPVTTVTAEVLTGFFLFVGVVVAALAGRSRRTVWSLGLAWFLVTILPVSNFVVRADVLLAERTLYLPSVGASFVAAALASALWRHVSTPRARVAAVGTALAVGALLLARTVARNPTWMSTYTVISTLAREHPESWMSQRAAAAGFERIGDVEAAREAWERAVVLAPDHFQVLVEAAAFHEGAGEAARADALLEQAIRVLPGRREAHERLASWRLLRGDGPGAHAAALRGLAHVGSDRDLWALLSESYVMKGDLLAAVRARRAALAAGESAASWRRLAALLDALERPDEAAAARTQAARQRRDDA